MDSSVIEFATVKVVRFESNEQGSFIEVDSEGERAKVWINEDFGDLDLRKLFGLVGEYANLALVTYDDIPPERI